MHRNEMLQVAADLSQLANALIAYTETDGELLDQAFNKIDQAHVTIARALQAVQQHYLLCDCPALAAHIGAARILLEQVPETY